MTEERGLYMVPVCLGTVFPLSDLVLQTTALEYASAFQPRYYDYVASPGTACRSSIFAWRTMRS